MENLDSAKGLADPEARFAGMFVKMIVREIIRIEKRFSGGGSCYIQCIASHIRSFFLVLIKKPW